MKKNSFTEGTIISYILLIITKILGVLYVIPFYKIVGTEGGVLYSYAYNVYNLLLNISTSGIPTAICIMIAEYNALNQLEEREYAYKVSTKIISIISTLAFLALFIFARSIGLFIIGDIQGGQSIESIVLVIRVISFCLLIVPFLSVTRGYMQGNKYITPSTFSQLIEQLVRIFVVLVGSYLTINILHFSIPVGISFALSGTTIGAIVAYLYLSKKRKKYISVKEIPQKNLNNSKKIIKKIAIYALPATIISVSQNIYELIDFKFIIKGLYLIGYDATQCELIASIIVTWAPKICMIINTLALGLCASIVPFVVDNYLKNQHKELNQKFNQAINIINFVSVPISFFIILYAKEIYSIFYGSSPYGGIILAALSIVSILFSIHLVINMILQGMKKYKLVYLNTIVGIVVNAILDIPLIILLNNIKFYPIIGTIVSTMIGQLISITIVFINLKKELNFKYKEIFKLLFKITIISALLLLASFILKKSLLNNINYNLIKVGISGLIFVPIYIYITYKTKLIFKIFSEEGIDKILKKLKINRRKYE
jgi:O-antigen/teichoic acid export membrane protein